MVKWSRTPPAICREHDGAELGPRAGQTGPDPGGPVRVQPRVRGLQESGEVQVRPDIRSSHLACFHISGIQPRYLSSFPLKFSQIPLVFPVTRKLVPTYLTDNFAVLDRTSTSPQAAGLAT